MINFLTLIFQKKTFLLRMYQNNYHKSNTFKKVISKTIKIQVEIFLLDVSHRARYKHK